ncbi:MAG: histidine--tRNA ligase [Spirochaetota bacterium]|nr:MAG: histidine--tRNA ligase [Spirochaetota bacterium]
MKSDLSVRGMRDYYPDVYSRLQHIINAWRKTALCYGFEEFEGPVIESLDLYKIKSGDEIIRQLYNFTDKGGRELALRPELTPTLARMIAKVQSEAPKPIKWFSIPRCMRYEKPQKGRLREFFQFNVDIIGEEEGLGDVEVISVAIDSLVALGLTERDFVVKINNRDFVSEYFKSMGVSEDISLRLYKIIDNARKVDEQTTRDAIDELNFNQAQKKALDDYLAIKNIQDLKSLSYTNDGKEALIYIFSLLEAAGMDDFCSLDVAVVRGLDYYTGTVYEIYDRSERMRAICGGGRYNHLLKEFGGIEIPACGFGMGDVVLGEVLAEKGLLPAYSRQIDYFLVRITEEELGTLLKVAHSLRQKGFIVEHTYRPLAVKKQMARASKVGANKVVIFGADELGDGKVTEKDMLTGKELKKALTDYIQ